MLKARYELTDADALAIAEMRTRLGGIPYWERRVFFDALLEGFCRDCWGPDEPTCYCWNDD